MLPFQIGDRVYHHGPKGQRVATVVKRYPHNGGAEGRKDTGIQFADDPMRLTYRVWSKGLTKCQDLRPADAIAPALWWPKGSDEEYDVPTKPVYGEQGYDDAYDRDQRQRAHEAEQWAEQQRICRNLTTDRDPKVRTAATSLLQTMRNEGQ